MMTKDTTVLKVLLITVAVLLVIAIGLMIYLAFGAREASYESIGMEYLPETPVYVTPEPTPVPETTPEPTPESEPEPTPEPEPTKDEDGFWPAEGTVTVDASELNVRATPSTDGARLGAVTGGTVLDRTGYSDEGWTRVIYDGQTAYVSSEYVVVN